MDKTLKGIAISRFVEERVQALKSAGLREDVLKLAIASLNNVAANHPTWDIENKDHPSLPNRPKFSVLSDGRAYSNIPIPRQQRHRFSGERQSRATSSATWAR